MLAFLHTAAVHVETFGSLARELDAAVPLRHEVREHLLAEARAAGMSDGVRADVAAAVRALAAEGAKVVVVTCSTIGAVAEAAGKSAGVDVLRIDRPMVEEAVASGRRVLVVAALQSTLAPTLELLHEVAAAAERRVEIEQLLCEAAWQRFELGDRAGYALAIARAIEARAKLADLVLLAQASMAPAAELVRHLGIPVLSSPRLGVQAAIAKYRAVTPRRGSRRASCR